MIRPAGNQFRAATSAIGVAPIAEPISGISAVRAMSTARGTANGSPRIFIIAKANNPAAAAIATDPIT
jgi:hypothetical protein